MFIFFNYFFPDNSILMMLLIVSLKKCKAFQEHPDRQTLLLKAMCLANVTKFFLLPIVVWKSQQSEFVVQLNFMIVMGYFLYGLIHVYSGKFYNISIKAERKFYIFVFFLLVISGFSRIHSAFSVISSLIIKAIMFNLIASTAERHLFPIKSF